ncbi:MAG TPA: hypothetical protein VM290_03325 [Gaiellaceae bacterium]|nr:hypothetical protein [Gaiellaceae bacterium]
MQRDLDRRLRDARGALARPGRDREDSAVAAALAGRRVRPVWRVALVAALSVAALTVSLGAVAAGSSPTREAAQPAVRVVDRTLSCMPGRAFDGTGARAFGFAVTKRSRYSSTTPWAPASLVLDGASPASARSKFVIVRGHESPSALAAPGLNGPGLGGVYVNTKSCVPSRKSVPLSREGLPGPAVRYETGTGCKSPGRILVRVRATLTAPARWREITPVFSGVQRNVTEMALAIRVERTGRPLLFAQARAASVALWRADSCR